MRPSLPPAGRARPRRRRPAVAAATAPRSDARMPPSPDAPADFSTILYAADGAVATITLNRPERLNTIVPPMPQEVQAAVGRAIRDPAVKVIVVRGAGRAFCAGYDFGRRLRALGRRDQHRRAVGPRQGLRRRDRARARAHPAAHERLALAEAGHRPGPRVLRRRRERLRALRGPRRRQRGRGHRHALQPDVGRLPLRDVDLPARPRAREVPRPDGAAPERAPGGRRRARQRGGPVRAPRGARGRARRRPGGDPELAARRDEARGQPRLRGHGPGLDPDARPDPRRPHAEHARTRSSSSAPRPSRASAPWSSAATARSATTARRPRSCAPTRATSSSPEAVRRGRRDDAGRDLHDLGQLLLGAPRREHQRQAVRAGGEPRPDRLRRRRRGSP